MSLFEFISQEGEKKVVENIGYVVNNVTQLSPAGFALSNGLTTGRRIGKAIFAYQRKGTFSSGVYINGASAALSGTACVLSLCSYLPGASLPCMSASKCCSALADTLDNSFGPMTFFT